MKKNITFKKANFTSYEVYNNKNLVGYINKIEDGWESFNGLTAKTRIKLAEKLINL